MRLAANPVLAREVRVRVRSWRAIAALLLYLLLVALVAWVAYESQRTSTVGAFSDTVTATETAGIGRSVFEWTLLLVLLLVHFSVPGVVSGAIAGERERQTLVPLQVTLLRPLSIVIGKISAAVAFILLLIVATMPILAIGYLIGGVSVGDILRATAGVIGTTLVLACVSAWCSAVARRVQVATVLAYGAMIVMTLGSFAVYGAAAVLDDRDSLDDPTDPPAALLYAAPIVAVADLLADSNDNDIDSPFDALAATSERDLDRPDDGVRDVGIPYWLESTIVLSAISVLAVWRAGRHVSTPAETER